MDLCETILPYLGGGNFPSVVLGFSMVGILEALSVVVIVFYVCTRTRASSLLGGFLPYRFDDTPIYFFNKSSQFFAWLYYNTAIFEQNVKQDATDHGVQDLLRVTQHAGRKPYSSIFDWGIYFPFLAQCVRLKRFPYPQVTQSVLKDTRLQRTIQQATEELFWECKANNSGGDCSTGGGDGGVNNENIIDYEETEVYQKLLKKQEKRAVRILTDMRSKISDILLRITSWILYKLLPCFLSGVVTHTKQIQMLRTAADKAPGIPLIFLPLHRSHLDYIMVSFILLNNDIRSPLVAAGNNLQIPVFGSLLRGLGAFFIKRKIDPIVGKKDTLYRSVLHLYMEHALEAGHNVEFFIEGGRTRTGKPCMPKNGILSVIVKAFMDGTIQDALLVPVSVNYERLVDGNFIHEQLGQKKKPESFRSAISGIWKVLNSSYGLMRIDFNEPFSIRELVQSYNNIAKEEGSDRIYKPAEKTLHHNRSSSSLYGTDVVCEEHRTLVDSISRQVVYDCAEATSVMTTNAVAFLLLTRFRNGILETVLAEELDNLRKHLKGRRDLGFIGDSIDIVRYACDLLGSGMISRSEQSKSVFFIQPVLKVPNVIELAYYSNSLTPHFALESIVITSIYYLLVDKPKSTSVSREKLKELCIEHCDILRYEFILSKPTQSLDNLLEETIDNLCSKDLVQFSEIQTVDDYTIQSRKLATYIENAMGDDDDGDYDYYLQNADASEVFLVEEKEFDHKALMNVLAPFSYAYLHVADCLRDLLGNAMLETTFIRLVIDKITKSVEKGDCPFGESISTESVKNCLKLFEKWGIIEICSQHGVRLISLANSYDSFDGVEKIFEKMEAVIPQIK